MMTDDQFAVVGRVGKTHGLRGEVSVVSAAGASLSVLTGLTVWFVPPSAARRTARIAAVRSVPRGDLVLFDGLDSITDASALVGREILVRSSDLPPEWFESLSPEDDAVGLAVTDSVHGCLGIVVETIHTGANDVWVVHGDFGEVLIPVIEDVVHTTDLDARVAHVTLLPGLMPGEDDLP